MLKKNIFGLSLLTVGLILLVLGLMNGELGLVWEKGAALCLQCMGLN